MVNSRPMTIGDLHADVLEEIFAKIDSFDDQLNLVRALAIFGRAFASRNRKVLRNFRFNHYKPEDAVDIVRLGGGSRIRSIDFTNGCGDHDEIHLLQLASKFCTNLSEIATHADDVRKIEAIVKMKQLKSLRLEYCFCREESVCPNHLVKSFLRPLEELPNLKRLTLFGFPSLDCELNHIRNLIQLEDLRLRGICRDSDNYVNIEQICLPLKNLRFLFLRSLGSVQFCQLKLEKLERLEIVDINVENSLPYFSNLKHLALFSRQTSLAKIMDKNVLSQYRNHLEKFYFLGPLNYEYAEIIGKLIALQDLNCSFENETSFQYVCCLKQLERLTFHNSSHLTNSILLSILQECKHLRYLCVQNCDKLNNDFIYNAFDICRSHRIEPNNPLKLFVYGTNIDDKIIKKWSTHPNVNLLNISFEYVHQYDDISMKI